MSCVVCNNKNCNCQIFHEETLSKVKANLIDDNKINNIVNYLKVLSDFTRMKIILSLKEAELCVCDIGSLVGITKSAVSHQMKTLRKNKIVKSRREGKMVYYSLNEKFSVTIFKDINNYLGGEV